jgi:hypothetical protein
MIYIRGEESQSIIIKLENNILFNIKNVKK